MLRTVASPDDAGVELDFCLIFPLLEGYDEPEILRSSSHQFCLTSLKRDSGDQFSSIYLSVNACTSERVKTSRPIGMFSGNIWTHRIVRKSPNLAASTKVYSGPATTSIM